MGGFVDPFIPSPAWPQDMAFAGSSWAGSASPLAVSSAQAMMEFHLRNGSSLALMNGSSAKGLAGASVFPAGDTVLPPAKLHEQLQQQSDDLAHVLDFTVDGAGTLGSVLSGGPPCPVSLTDSAPVICSSNESSGSEQSGSGGRSLSQFLMGEHPAAWAPAYASISPMAGEETSRSFGFGSISGDDLLHDAAARTPNGKNRYQQLGSAVPSPQLQLHDDAEFNTDELLSFVPGQQTTPSIDSLQMNQKEFSSGLHHLNLSSLVPGPPLAPFNPKQSAEDSTGKDGNWVAGSGAAPKPRVRARRGQATDPHSIAERLRREKISDRMKNLQELVPNANKTDKASMLEEIIEYIKFLQLQTKVLSMSRLGATEAVVPLLTESQNESSGLLLSPGSRSGERHAGGGVLAAQSDELHLEQEMAQLMENNMTAAMQYLQSKGLCLMPIGLASAISTQKGTSSAAVRPEARGGGGAAGGSGDKDDMKRALHGLKNHHGSAKGMKSKIN